MKICWVTSYPPMQSGIANYSESLLKELKKIQQVDVLVWNYTSWLERIVSPFRNFRSLIAAFRDHDIIHIQYVLGEYMVFFLPVLCLLRLLPGKRAAVVLTSHEDYRNLRFSWLVEAFHNLFYCCADLLMVHTKEHRSVLSKRLQDRTIVIPFGTQPQHILSETKKNTILLQGFINPWKGHDLAIRAMEKVCREIPSAKLVIAGKPHNNKFTEEIHALVKELNLQRNVEILQGFLPDKQFKRLLQSSEICLLPYRRITMSAILSDVLGYGKPCVLSDLPAFKEYTKNKAVYFASGNSDELAEKIVFLLKNRSARQAMQRDFGKLARSYAWPKVAHLTLGSYNKVSVQRKSGKMTGTPHDVS